MEQINHPRGDADEITSQQPIQTDQLTSPLDVPRYRAEAPAQRSPLTFEEAEAHNPFALLGELRDHAMALRIDEKPPEFHLTELALSAAVVAWWSRWQPIAMHRAFVAGANLAEVAAATGVDESEAYERWSRWAQRQSTLRTDTGRLGIDLAELAEVRARIEPRMPG